MVRGKKEVLEGEEEEEEVTKKLSELDVSKQEE